MNTRVMGIRLQYAPAGVRALVVQALREKATGDRKAADTINAEDRPDRAHDSGRDRAARVMREQAELAEQVAEELEGE